VLFAWCKARSGERVAYQRGVQRCVDALAGRDVAILLPVPVRVLGLGACNVRPIARQHKGLLFSPGARAVPLPMGNRTGSGLAHPASAHSQYSAVGSPVTGSTCCLYTCSAIRPVSTTHIGLAGGRGRATWLPWHTARRSLRSWRRGRRRAAQAPGRRDSAWHTCGALGQSKGSRPTSKEKEELWSLFTRGTRALWSGRCS